MLLWIGGSLAAVGALVHAVGGERFLVGRLRNEGLPSSPIADPDLARQYLRVCWHLVTVDLALSAALLFLCAAGSLGAAVARTVAAHFAGYALVAIGVVLGSRRFDAFVRVPQIYLLPSIAAAAWFGA